MHHLSSLLSTRFMRKWLAVMHKESDCAITSYCILFVWVVLAVLQCIKGQIQDWCTAPFPLLSSQFYHTGPLHAVTMATHAWTACTFPQKSRGLIKVSHRAAASLEQIWELIICVFTDEDWTVSRESGWDIVWSCPFTHVAHNKRLFMSKVSSEWCLDKFSVCLCERTICHCWCSGSVLPHGGTAVSAGNQTSNPVVTGRPPAFNLKPLCSIL